MKILLPCQNRVTRVDRQYSKHLAIGHNIVYFSDIVYFADFDFHLILGKTTRKVILYLLLTCTATTIIKINAIHIRMKE